MGNRGPQPTPMAILRARGSWRGDLNRSEPRPEPGRPVCPSWLNAEAKKAWRSLVPQLAAMRVLTRIDGHALARYCLLWARWRKAEEFIEKHGDTYPVKHRGELLLKTFPQVRNADRLATQLARLEQAVRMDRGQLHHHPGATRIVERMRELSVPLSEQPMDGEVALMMASRGVRSKGFELVERIG